MVTSFLCGEIKSEREQDKAPMSILCFLLGYGLCHVFSHSVGQIKSGGQIKISAVENFISPIEGSRGE